MSPSPIEGRADYARPRLLSDFVEDPYGPPHSFYSFGNPSGRIQCRVVDGTGLVCQTAKLSHTVAETALCGCGGY